MSGKKCFDDAYADAVQKTTRNQGPPDGVLILDAVRPMRLTGRTWGVRKYTAAFRRGCLTEE